MTTNFCCALCYRRDTDMVRLYDLDSANGSMSTANAFRPSNEHLSSRSALPADIPIVPKYFKLNVIRLTGHACPVPVVHFSDYRCRFKRSMNTIWYGSCFKGRVYETRETVWLSRRQKSTCGSLEGRADAS